MQNSVTGFILLIATIVAALSVFGIYFAYTSVYSPQVANQEYLISLSKAISASISEEAFKGIPPSYECFNVSYLIWIKSITPKITLVPFVTCPQKSICLYIPNSQQNAVILSSGKNCYSQIKSFIINCNIYLPQQCKLLGKASVYAFNITSNETYELLAKVKPGQIVVIWILYYYQGKWYRLDFTYANPSGEGLGVYIITSSGSYSSYSKPTNVKAPHVTISQTGFQMGLWFKEISTSAQKSILLNDTLVPNGNTEKEFSIIFYECNSKLYVCIVCNKGIYTRGLIGEIKEGCYYFLDFVNCEQTANTKQLSITLYDTKGIIASDEIPLPIEVNGYTLIAKFGCKNLVNSISQSFFEVLKSKSSSLTGFDKIEKTIYNHGFLYNDTSCICEIIKNCNNLYAIGYWYFVCSSSFTPPYINGILWYYSHGNLCKTCIPEVGQNTYILT